MHETGPTTHRWVFWIILGAYSTFFAEVFSGSAMFPFFETWGILVVWPLYGLHTILLTAILFKRGKPTFPGLVFAGMLFGLYEAYITKVLWQPPWGASLMLADIAVVEVFVLVFWWHAWFAFITPVALGEQLLTSSRPILHAMGGKLREFYASWKGWLALFIFGGVFQSVNSPSVGASLLSGLASGGFLVLLTWLWKRISAGRQYTFNELLPKRKEFAFLSVWLGALYLFLGFSITPERIPGLSGQGIIVLLYLLLIMLLVIALQSSQKTMPIRCDATDPTGIPYRHWLRLWGAFIITLVLARTFLGGLSGVVVLVSWLYGSLFGAAMFILALKAVLHRKTKTTV
jgi:hypothetical protein